MKGLILSGGKGTRLRPITFTSAKQLVPVGNKPILFYGIEALVASGIKEIGIIVGDTHKDIKAAVGDGSKWNIKVTYIQQDAPRGLAHAVMIAEDFMDGNDFVMYLGDNMIMSGVQEFIEGFNKAKPDASILLAHVPNPSSFGVAELDGEKVVKLVEKPKEPKSDLALVGVYLFSNEIFKAVKSIEPSPRNELEITDAIQWLIENSYNVSFTIIKGWWKDTGKLNDMLEANRMVLDTIQTEIKGSISEDSEIHGRVRIADNVEVKNSIIRGPVVIGEGTKIINSYIGPYTSISEGCYINESEIEHSIILQNSRIDSIETRIEGSLLGKNVKVSKSKSKPRSNRFMVGDNSEIIIL
ncbi:glucose-1-phosphate thymidylyltransferase [Candidatus Dependentiae bacterium]|nr:glucose-1-phosphate thymidylyltransferase [Candidatus Dependentiae bacterium]